MSTVISPTLRGEQAIVIGGGIAGLLTAHILTEFFERVTIVERDDYPAEPVFRPGTPQSRHVHTILARDLQILEELFPGMREKLVRRGAHVVDVTQDIGMRLPSGWLPHTPSQVQTVICTRVLLEWQIRQEVLRNPCVQVMEGSQAIGLLSDDANNVTGVQICARSQGVIAVDQFDVLKGELVVDASGRDSRAPQWLKALGYPVPQESVVNTSLGYATRYYTPPPNVQPKWKGIIIQPDRPKNPRGGIIWPIENDQWQVTLVGASKEYPPIENEAFLAFAKTLPSPLISEALKDAWPLSPIYAYRGAENRLRHYERLTRMPDGFFVLGDAACAFHPVYGQGMSVAAMGAIQLRGLLRQRRQRRKHGLKGVSRRFQRQLARINAACWQVAISLDAPAPIVDGMQPDPIRRRLMQGLMEILPDNAFASQRFLEVLHLLRPQTALLHPLIVLAILLRKR